MKAIRMVTRAASPEANLEPDHTYAIGSEPGQVSAELAKTLVDAGAAVVEGSSSSSPTRKETAAAEPPAETADQAAPRGRKRAGGS